MKSKDDDGAKPPLRIALFLDRWDQPRWVEWVLEDLRAQPELFKISLIIKGDQPERERQAPNHLLYRIYSRLDQAVFANVEHVLHRRDIRPLLSDTNLLEISPRRTRYSDYVLPKDLEQIRNHNPDLGLRFGFRILRGEILDAFRWGIWSYHHGDDQRYRGGPPGFWEVFENHPVTGTVLQRLTEDLDAGAVLQRSYASTNRNSVTLSQNNYYRKASAFVSRALVGLAHDPEAFEARLAREGESLVYSYPLYRAPTNIQMLKVGPRHLVRRLRTKLPSMWARERWGIGIGSVTSQGSLALHRTKHVRSPRDVFWADPFPIRGEGGLLYIFVEEFPFRSGRGRIALLEFDEVTLNLLRHHIVLEEDHHLSYPFIFEFEGKHYLMPEASTTGRVTAYQAAEFPWRWGAARTVIHLGLVDPTLLEHDGRWWLFGNLGVRGSSVNDELHAFYAKSPFGPWTPHPANPVRSDVRGARPAGNFFRRDGHLYRPGQDCSDRYGGSIMVHRVELSVDSYHESCVARLEPSWDNRVRGLHTLNFVGTRYVVDMATKEGRFSAPVLKR
jgi:hypothetical protein